MRRFHQHTRSAALRPANWAAPLCLAVALVPACSSYNGVAEFTVYDEAYRSAAATGENILDRLAVAERQLYDIAEPFDPLFSEFDPGKAGLVSDAADPPATAAYRGTLRAISTYNRALLGLASGAEAERIAGQVAQLGAIGTAAAADIAGLAGRSPGTVAAVTALNTVLAGLQPVASKLLAFRTREEFREQLIANAGVIREAIAEARASTARAFGLMRDAVIAKANSDPARTGLTEAEVGQIREYRRLLAGWVVLLDASQQSFDAAVTAAETESAGLEGLLLAGGDLAAAVRAARITLADDD